jgi:hypothetical protein
MMLVDMTQLPVGYIVSMAWTNVGICVAIGWTCISRISKMSAQTTLARWRACYSISMAGSVCSGLSPILWGEWPGPGQLSMGLVVLIAILWGWSDWRNGPPAYARRAQ